MKYLRSILLLVTLGVVTLWAQPPMPDPILETDWTSGSDNPLFNFADEQTSGPVVYDLTGDGMQEVIVTGRKDIWVFNLDYPDFSNPLFHWTVQAGYEFCSPVTVAHLSFDAYPWVVVGASFARHFESGGCPCPGWPGHEYPDPDCHVYGDCYHWESVIHGWKIIGSVVDDEFSDVRLHQRLTTPAAADVDGDGVDELCFVGSNSYGMHDGSNLYSTVGVHFYEYNNGFVELGATNRKLVPWGLENYTGLSGISLQIAQIVPAAGDLNSDGKPEFVTQVLWRIQAWTFAGDHQDGSILWEDSTTNGDYLCLPDRCLVINNPEPETRPWQYGTWDGLRSPGPVLANLDPEGGGQLDVFITTNNGGGFVWKRDGQTGTFVARYEWQTPHNEPHESGNGSELVVGDDFESGQPSLFSALIATNEGQHYTLLRTWRWDRNLTIYPGPTNAFPYDSGEDQYPAEDSYAPALLPSDVGAGFTVDIAAQYDVIFQRCLVHDSWSWNVGDASGPVQSNISAADLDRDGLMEYVLSNRISGTQSTLYAFPTTQPYNPEKFEWSGYRNSPKHTGLYAQPVTGAQPREEMTWSGRYIVHGTYAVAPMQTLTIKPGTVVEFRPGAKLRVWGHLVADGTELDSIYFKADGTTRWHGIDLVAAQSALLDHCVIHHCSTGVYVASGTNNRIWHCRIYDVLTTGIEVTAMTNPDALQCSDNDISGAFYGIRGTGSSGSFWRNNIHDCSRAGIYWYADGYAAIPPTFGNNLVHQNGSGTYAVAGGYFNSTTARLECNLFENNLPYQISGDNHADLTMGELDGNGAVNTLLFNLPVDNPVWC